MAGVYIGVFCCSINKGGGIMANGWGGKRAGAGRRPAAADGTERKMRSLRASDAEWEAIKQFAKFIKDNPDKLNEAVFKLA